MHLSRKNRKANEVRRSDRAKRLALVPLESIPFVVVGQCERAELKAKAHAERYPNPPKYDAFVHVRGNPDLRGVRPSNQKDPCPLPILTKAHLMAAFNVDKTSTPRKKKTHKQNPKFRGKAMKIMVGTPRDLPGRN